MSGNKRTGRPGPVVIDLPKDIQQELGMDVYPTEVNIRSYKPNETVHMGQIKKAVSMLNKAQKPIFLIGGGVNIARAQKEMTQLAEKTGVPVITTIMGKISEFAKNAAIIRIDVDSASISKNIVVDIPIVADAKLAIEKLLEWVLPTKAGIHEDREKE